MAVTLQEMLNREFGVKTTFRANPLVSSCAITLTKLLSNNPNRLASVLVNLGANDIYIGFDVETSAAKGILLANSGGGINFKWDSEFNLLEAAMYGIAVGGASAIYVLEIVTEAIEDKPFRVIGS